MYAHNIDQPVAFILMILAIRVLIFGCILAAIDNTICNYCNDDDDPCPRCGTKDKKK